MVRGRLLLSLDHPATAADTHRPLAQEVVLQPLLSFTDGALTSDSRLEVRKGWVRVVSQNSQLLYRLSRCRDGSQLWFLYETGCSCATIRKLITRVLQDD